MKPMWAVYGAFELEELGNAPIGVAPLMWIYVLLSSVVLVNLLVAMFSDTYTKVVEQAEKEFRYQRYQRMYSAQNVWDPIPPPFSLPINALKLFRAAMRVLLAPFRTGAAATARGAAIVDPSRFSVGGTGSAADLAGGRSKPPAQSKRLQLKYLEHVEAEEAQTVEYKTTEVQGAMNQIHATQGAQFILLRDLIKDVTESAAG